jgi:hypothetical protein
MTDCFLWGSKTVLPQGLNQVSSGPLRRKTETAVQPVLSHSPQREFTDAGSDVTKSMGCCRGMWSPIEGQEQGELPQRQGVPTLPDWSARLTKYGMKSVSTSDQAVDAKVLFFMFTEMSPSFDLSLLVGILTGGIAFGANSSLQTTAVWPCSSKFWASRPNWAIGRWHESWVLHTSPSEPQTVRACLPPTAARWKSGFSLSLAGPPKSYSDRHEPPGSRQHPLTLD